MLFLIKVEIFPREVYQSISHPTSLHLYPDGGLLLHCVSSVFINDEWIKGPENADSSLFLRSHSASNLSSPSLKQIQNIPL